MRTDNRQPDQLRPLQFTRGFTSQAPGSVLTRMGKTLVLCTCSVEAAVPPFLVGTGRGWLTAEYSMLPGSTSPRKPRDRGGKVDGRSIEIQRLIGRSLRAVVALDRLPERTLAIDCDVLQADGGTRTAAINGAYVALVDALRAIQAASSIPATILSGSVAAISVGILNDVEILDLDYAEDKDAQVDMNVVMTGFGQFIEVQGTGERISFSEMQLERLLKLGKLGIAAITSAQKHSLGADWPLD